jgi:hypothetical protein
MEMLNRAGNGGYPVGLIGLAKANPGHDVAKLEYGK